jgi:hypothetical protein
MSATRLLDETQFVNAFQVIGTGATVTNADGSTSPGVPVVGFASSNDPQLGTSGPLGQIVGTLTVDTVSTVAQANAMAAAQLALNFNALTNTNFVAVDDPRLDAGDAAFLIRARLDGRSTRSMNNTYYVQSVIHPFNLVDGMQVTNRPYVVADIAA